MLVRQWQHDGMWLGEKRPESIQHVERHDCQSWQNLFLTFLEGTGCKGAGFASLLVLPGRGEIRLCGSAAAGLRLSLSKVSNILLS